MSSEPADEVISTLWQQYAVEVAHFVLSLRESLVVNVEKNLFLIVLFVRIVVGDVNKTTFACLRFNFHLKTLTFTEVNMLYILDFDVFD